MQKRRTIDKPFLFLVIILVLGGFFIFISASLGLHAREGARFGAVALNQLFFGLILGSFFMWFFSRLHYRFWKTYALHIFLFAVSLTALVFIPFLGVEHGGARRWLSIGPFSLQPAELLKLAVVVFLAAWFSSRRYNTKTLKGGLVPLLVVISVTALLLLSQPDTGTFIIILAAASAMFLIAGGSGKHISMLLGASISAVAVLILARPYILERIMTFLDPSRDPMGAGWQIKQSLIAIGSGGIFGKGFGQSIQKFSFLPEPIGDSIFAVAAEEFGFLGAVLIIAAFIFFLLRGLYIARRAPDNFSGLLVAGIVIMIVFQAFFNIGAMLGVLPLTGLPLLFVSHGGTALLFTLVGVGIILNVSRYKRSL